LTEVIVEPTAAKPGRPFWLSVLAVLFLLLVAAGWLRFAEAWRFWDLLAKFAEKPGPLYLLLGGAAWGLAGLPAAIGLWFGWRWAIRVAWIAAVFYPLTYWLDRLLIDRAPQALTAWPFSLVVTLLWLGFVFINLRSRNAQRFCR
jgi:hypothetical protein